MQAFEHKIVKSVCPNCGQTALKPVRRLRPAAGLPRAPTCSERCLPCELANAGPSERGFLIRQARLMWMSAGGRTQDMPDCLRLPGDPPKPPAAPVALPPAPRGQDVQPLKRGQDTPAWKSPAKVLAPPPAAQPRPKVLFVSHDLKPQGAQRFLLNLLPHLRGIQPHLYAIEDGPLAELFRQRGIPVVKECRPKDYALLVANTLASFPAVKAAEVAGVPSLWLIHEWGLSGLIDPLVFGGLSRCPRKSVFVHAAQKAMFPGMGSLSTCVLPPVVPPFLPHAGKALPGPDAATSRPFVVLSFGEDEPRKGQDDLRAACKGLTVELRCVAGSLDPREELAAADLYVSSSRQECYPLSLQEAKQHRLPVIATSLPVHREMIDNGVNGYLYEPGDVEHLRELIGRVAEDPALRVTMGERPLRCPDWQDSLREWESLIVREAGGGNAAPDDLHVVYHACGMGETWKEVFREQLSLLARHGLRRILCTHCGEGLDWLYQAAYEHGLDMIVCYHQESIHCYERPAIELIERLAAGGNKPVLYLHSKAVSHAAAEGWYSEWRRLMQNELVPAWRRHAAALGEYDAVGVNWWRAKDKEHFSGNFWLASAEWLRKLPPINSYWRDRFSAERWIGSTPGCRALSLLCHDAAFWDRDRAMLHELRNAQLARHKGQEQ